MKYLYLSFFTLLLAACNQQNTVEVSAEESNKVDIGEKIVLTSDVLGEDREIWIYVPKEFYGMDKTNVRYPVAYVMDGEGQFVSTVGTIDQMSSPYTANDLIPQMIVVGVVNTNRNRDLTPTPGMLGRDSSTISITGGADRMASFMEKELIPYIEDKYPAAPHRVLIGHSLGGLFVLNTLMKSPNLFQNYLAIDPFLEWDKQNFSNTLVAGLQGEGFKDENLYIATGNTRMSWLTLEDVMTDTTDVMYAMKANLEFKDTMETFEVDFDYRNQYYKDENHFQIPLKATYDGLRYFYDFYPFPEMIEFYYPREQEPDLLYALEKHYDKISKEMKYEIVPSESYINSWAFGFIEFDRSDLAMKLFDLNIENYPESYNVYSSKAHALLGQKDTLNAIQYFNKCLDIKDLPHIRFTLEAITNSSH